LDDFFEEANATIKSNGLNVEFLLDGDGNPGQHTCLANRWRPVESMFISTDDPPASFTNDDPALGYDRLKVLNEPAGPVWSLAAALGFGKFASGSRPYIVWEPSDAAGMLGGVQTYLQHVSVEGHEAGFRNAINTDIAQWASYTAPATGAWWRGSAPGISGSSLEPRWNPLLATMPLSRSGYSGHLAISLASTTLTNGSTVRVCTTWRFMSTTSSSIPPVLATIRLPPSVDPTVNSLDLVALGKNNGTALALLSGPRGTQSLLVAEDGAVSLGASFPPSTTNSLATGFISCDVDGSICQVTASLRVDCALLLSFGRLGAVPTASVCIVTTGAAMNVSVAVTSFVRGGSIDPQIAVALVYVNGAGTVFGATACAPAALGVQDMDIRINEPGCFGELPPGSAFRVPREQWPYQPGTNESLALYVGHSARLRLVTHPSRGPEGGDSVGVLAIAGGSHCANNEADNKRSDVALCNVPPPMDGEGGYLSYHAGSLQGFTALLLGAECFWRSYKTGGAGACSGLISTGMFAQGGAGGGLAPALIGTPGGLEAFAIIEGAKGSAGGAAVDPRHCGSDTAAPDDTIILSWPIAQDYFP